ncbi:MAG: hypothetical protein ACK5MT_06050 [Actinomycetales bacterium]
MQHTMPRRLSATLVTGLLLGLGGGLPGIAQAAPATRAPASAPVMQEYFICPSVSNHNARGSWVIGGHGAYYVLIPSQGDSDGRVYLTVPTRVFDQAQVPAGWALYKDVLHDTADDGRLIFTTDASPTGSAMLLAEGLSWFPGAEALAWSEGDQVSIIADANGGFTAHNMGNPMTGAGDKGTISLPGEAFVPAASGVFW